MKAQNVTANGNKVTKATDLTQLAALMMQFAAQNPALQAEIAALSQPKQAKKQAAKPAAKAEFAVFQGINVTEGYTSKNGKNRTFIIYGEGTRAIKDKLFALEGSFNGRLSTQRAGIPGPDSMFKGFVFKAENRAKVLKALK